MEDLAPFSVETEASIAIQFQAGRIVYYFGEERFYAECVKHGAGCRLGRGRRRYAGSDPAAGRPLGLLVAWLIIGTAECHADPLGAHDFDWETRRDCREYLHSIPGAEKLFEKERKQDEPTSEPEGDP